MGNSVSNEDEDIDETLPNKFGGSGRGSDDADGSQSLADLRAKLQKRRSSFFLLPDDGGDGPSLEETIENLGADIEILSQRCARLEAQNILVSVQQLDILARTTAILLSFITLLVYWRLLWWTWEWLPPQWLWLQQQFPQIFQQQWFWNIPYPLAVWTLLKYILVPFPYLYNRWTYNCAHRRFEVFCVAAVIIGRMKMCSWRARMFANEANETKKASDTRRLPRFGVATSDDAIWEANYEISARFLYLSILRLRGLWTKSAQYLSSRADFVPVSYVRELKKLQDEAPATPWSSIRLPRRVTRALTHIDPQPLASASIGQVHTAHKVQPSNSNRQEHNTNKRPADEKVVIKVQHPHARTLLLDDFWSLAVIARFVAWMDPEYEFFAILMREWAQEARKELDFLSEARNLLLAQQAIDSMYESSSSPTAAAKAPTANGKPKLLYTSNGIPFQVEIPTPDVALSDKNVLVMNFCEGKRVDDFEALDKWGLQRDDVMDAVAQTFAHLMYCSPIFNGDPHPGNILIRPNNYDNDGENRSSDGGFTLVLLDWGLAKELPELKRIAFSQMAYAAATFNFGLLLDAFDTIGLKMKRENVAEDMEGMRFFLRDMAPRETARKRIKSYINKDQQRMKERKKGQKVVMESKAYPGEFFFFIRVNELLHGLGSRMSIHMAYLDLIMPYAERGLKNSIIYSSVPSIVDMEQGEMVSTDAVLESKLEATFQELNQEGNLAGAQICVLNQQGEPLANVTAGHLGGLRSQHPITPDSLILGFSCTKGVTATIAHILVQEGYLQYDEPVAQRVWPSFCPSQNAPMALASALDLSEEEAEKRWNWKRQITLRHILTHQSGLWSAMPATMTVKSMSSCEACVKAFEYNPDKAQDTLLPSREPGELSEYHFMSFGWLVAGTVCGAYSMKHYGKEHAVTFEEVYEAVLRPKLSETTLRYGFQPCGGSGGFPAAETTTADIKASQILQRRREAETLGEQGGTDSEKDGQMVSEEVMKSFRGKEFLLDPRIWNCSQALKANVPAAGGRFSAMGLASFYHDVGSGKVLHSATLQNVTSLAANESNIRALQGATVMADDSDENRTQFGLGYQLIRFDTDDASKPNSFGHAGVGGSIGFHHKKLGLSVGLMMNKADNGREVTMKILRVVAEHFSL